MLSKVSVTGELTRASVVLLMLMLAQWAEDTRDETRIKLLLSK